MSKHLKRREPKEYEKGFSESRAKGISRSKTFGSTLKSTSTEIPAYVSLDIIGDRNSIMEVSSMGEEINAEGYQTGTQSITPTITSPNVIDSDGQPFKGIKGGPRAVFSINKRMDLFCWKIVGGEFNSLSDDNKVLVIKPSSTKDYKLVPSPDTVGYAKIFLDLSRLMRNTQATYLPIAQATANHVDMDVYFQDIIVDGERDKYTDGFGRVGGIEAQKIADALGCDLADAHIYLFLMQMDLDWSNTCLNMDKFVDAFYKSLSLQRQKNWGNRDMLDLIYREAKRSVFKNPIVMMMEKLSSKTYISSNFFNDTIRGMSRMSSKFDGYSHASLTTVLTYPRIYSYEYQLGASTQTKNSIQDYDEMIYTAKNTIGDRIYRERVFYTSPHIRVDSYIKQRDKTSLLNYMTGFIEWITALDQKLDSQYASIDSLFLSLSQSLGFKAPVFDSKESFKPSKASYPTYFESLAFSSLLVSTNPSAVFQPAVDAIPTKSSHLVLDVAKQMGGILILQEQTKYDPAVGLVIRCPVDRGGNVPTILKKDLCYKNITIDRLDQSVYSDFAAGQAVSLLIVLDEDGDPYNLIHDTTTTVQKYAQDFAVFVDWIRGSFYASSVSFKLTGVTLKLNLLSFHLYMDSTIAVVPNKKASYEYGLVNNPLVKVTADLLIR